MIDVWTFFPGHRFHPTQKPDNKKRQVVTSLPPSPSVTRVRHFNKKAFKYAPLKQIKSWATRRWQENVVKVPSFKALEKPDVINHIVANICPKSFAGEKVRFLGCRLWKVPLPSRVPVFLFWCHNILFGSFRHILQTWWNKLLKEYACIRKFGNFYLQHNTTFGLKYR